MSSTVELTYQDVAEHNTKKDIYVVVHDKIYDCTQFVDEHPYVFTLPWSVEPPFGYRRSRQIKDLITMLDGGAFICDKYLP